MDIISSHNSLSGKITVPGSKSHTIRALILATLSDGTSIIRNPLPSADCLSTAAAVPLIGSEVDLNLSEEGEPGTQWVVRGAGKNIHLPDDVVNVGNSGSLLYFLSPVCANFNGISIFTGDDSIRKRPVEHVADALRQLGARAETSDPSRNGCPLVIKGPVHAGTVNTPGEISSQYISGLMMAGALLDGKLTINLSNPKETPYLTMTQKWMERAGFPCSISPDFKKIEVEGPVTIKPFDVTIPSDWEGVAFPLIAALMTDSEITIENVDSSGTQGDDAIVEVLKSVGADIEWDKNKNTLTVRGGKKARNGNGKLSTQNLPDGELRVKMNSFPDAICALAVIATQIEGKVVLEDAEVCRRKETDRLKVLNIELSKLGAKIEEKEDALIIYGGSPLHGGTAESYDDHRMAMALSCLGLALPPSEKLIIKDAECCAVSFPHYFELMNGCLGAGFIEA
jgi:3-phosphoshikimate 1-carboxyvinyltransferase